MEEWELEKQLLDLAFYNSYLVITEQTSFEELMIENHKEGKSAVLAHDPHEGPNTREMENLFNHFINLEEYEICSELQKAIGETSK